jgi:parallel beta-helix repeat protein
MGLRTVAGSNISYANIQYGGAAGNGTVGLAIANCSPTISNVSISGSTGAGLSVGGGSPTLTNITASSNQWGVTFTDASNSTLSGATLSNNTPGGGVRITGSPGSPKIVNSSFSGNTVGVSNLNPGTPVLAYYNSWNAADGPSGSGSGSGQWISSGVPFEPWLTSPPNPANLISNIVQTNRTSNPSIGVTMTVNFSTTLSGNWTVTIRNSGGMVIRTISGSGSTGPAVWDGKNDGGVTQPDGTYSYQIASVAAGPISTAPARGLAILDSTKQLAVSNLAVSQSYFSPNGDGVQDTTAVTGTTSFSDATWTVNVLDPSSTVIRTASGAAGTPVSFTWDGKNQSGTLQPDAFYTFQVIVTDGTASATSTIGVTLDNTVPAASILSPTDYQVLSNVYGDSVNIPVTGSVSDQNLLSWTLEYLVTTTTPNFWQAIQSGSGSVSSSPLGTWATLNFVNGVYQMRIRASDRAGNQRITLIHPILGFFWSKMDNHAFAVGVSGYTSIDSYVPFTLNETIVMKNKAGAVVKTIFSGQRSDSSGIYNTWYQDRWYGINDASVYVPDGPYFYSITVTAGTHTLVWDQTNEYLNDGNYWRDGLNIQPWDPFNNTPMTLTYSFSPNPVRTSIVMSTQAGGDIQGDCANQSPDFFCALNAEYQDGSTHVFRWDGVDPWGVYRGDTIKSIGCVGWRTYFSKNAVVRTGTAPTVSNVAVTPPMYSPNSGTQSIAFDLTTYQSTGASVAITFRNMESNSVLRTVNLTGQSPGHIVASWDGKADNGMFVAPGTYEVTVTVTDYLGNVVKGQILTTIQY